LLTVENEGIDGIALRMRRVMIDVLTDLVGHVSAVSDIARSNPAGKAKAFLICTVANVDLA
jgi:hypothetical protein